ncbi:DUF4185 domain-containing protein [Planctomycetales bacterium ZRK34]|nr:DUF4185 domain-containing protein [Planctomycetales bacterium ZRK34]
MSQFIFRAMPVVAALLIGVASAEQQPADASTDAENGQVWPSEPPEDIPFAPSQMITGLRFTGRHITYTGADTWYPSWAADGNLYSPWTDGEVNGIKTHSGNPHAAGAGSAKIIGDDPLNLQVVEPHVEVSKAHPYQGRYPCGSLVYNGVWYYGTYCLYGNHQVRRNGIVYDWPWIGPFVGFSYSTDLGKTWTQSSCTPADPLFGERVKDGQPVKIGAPHFVDFGKNMEHSPDGKAYLVAHGASDGDNRRFAYDSWITGDEIYLVRVTPSIENINDESKYEYFDGRGWTKDFDRIKPIATWRDRMGCVTMTYNAPLKKYLMCVTDGETTSTYFNTYILEADKITGPYKLAHYLRHFGEQAYFVSIPSKFISADGRTMWMCYAANFARNWNGTRIQVNPPGSRYGMCLQEITLTLTP